MHRAISTPLSTHFLAANKPTTTVNFITRFAHSTTTTNATKSNTQPSTTLTPTEQVLQNHRLTEAAQAIWSQILRPGDTAVDATCGNGHDTFFLCSTVGPTGKVYGFDIQQAAIDATRERCDNTNNDNDGDDGVAGPQLELHRACHSTILEVVGENVARLVCFNLGYLPGSDKETTTTTDTTIAALNAAMTCLQPGGSLLSVLCYTGHDGGGTEYTAVKGLLEDLEPSLWTSGHVQLLNRPTAPILLLAWKRMV